MAKRKENSRRPQPRHKRKLGPSQFDKRRRLATPNPNRKKTVRARVPLIGGLAAMAASMGALLDARMGFRLAIIMAGMVLAGERRVAAAWFVNANIACWNLNQWMYTLVELCSWDAPKADLVDRADRPWDNPDGVRRMPNATPPYR
ncbi:MAG: hypothetical protein FJ297_17455 [Planctomycetes bacterium]|nr:hypothetical protein [Planctomycetota bacterium]